jgi:putative hemolysin
MILSIAELILIVILLVLSFVFSGSEVSLFSLSEIDRLKLVRDKNRSRQNELIVKFLNHPERALITILFGNMLVNLSASILGERLAGSIFRENPLLLSVFIMTFLIVLFGEILPKNIASHRPVTFARVFIGVIDAVYKVFYPVIYLMTRLVSRGDAPERKTSLTKDELISAIEVGMNAGIDETTLSIFKNMIGMIDRPVTDIMVPRANVCAVNVDDRWKNIESHVKDTPHSDVVFFRDNIDNIIGFSPKMDLIDVKKKDFMKAVREPIFIPESKTILSLLNDFKVNGSYLAVILDEYGGTVGLVTLKDILDSIFVRDLLLSRLIRKKGEGRWLVGGETKISDMNRYFDLDLPDDTHTVSGYLINMAGTIPSPGQRCSFIERFDTKVIESDGRQITLVEMKRRDR